MEDVGQQCNERTSEKDDRPTFIIRTLKAVNFLSIDR